MNQNFKTKKSISPFLLVIISFVGIILLGSFFLSLPISRTNGNWGTYIDSLFVATSGTCVTGLSSVTNGVGKDFTFFGQLVLLICIQIGGLGFITIFAFIVTLFRRKMEFKNALFLTMAVGTTTIANLKSFVRKVILISLSFELLGFLLGLPVFIELFKGQPGLIIWNSLFHSISAFNNAGFDIFGNVSLVLNRGTILDKLSSGLYTYYLIYTMILIVAGGLSFLTYIDVINIKKIRRYRSSTKIVLLMTLLLIIIGYIAFMLTDSFKEVDKMSPLDCIFQSITLRTAGFASYDQANLSIAGRIVSCILMFIGGSPLSTAGGIKTTTIFIIILAVVSYMRGKPVSAFNRRFSEKTVLKAMSVVFLGIVIIIIGTITLCLFEVPQGKEFSDLTYEVFSAFGTVGVTTGITPSLTIGSKITLCIIMLLGRLGPITMFQIFQKNMNIEEKPHFTLVEEEVTI